MAKTPANGGLNDQHSRFVDEYMIDLNAGAAARRAGYAESSSAVRGHKILQREDVQAELARRMAERSARTRITSDMVVQEMGKIAFASLENYITVTPEGSAIVDLSKADPSALAALSEITTDIISRGEEPDVERVKIKMADKLGALRDLGRHLGMFEKDNKRTVEPGEQFSEWLAGIRAKGSKAPIRSNQVDDDDE